MRLILLFLLLVSNISCQESAQYLQNAVRDLRRLNYRQTLRRADTALVQNTIKEDLLPVAEKRIHHRPKGAPTLSLTKGELASLYENALAKGDTLKLDVGDNSYIHTAVHEIENHDDSPQAEESKKEDGYYYYYYPIKSFIDEMTSQAGSNSHEYYSHKEHKPVHVDTTEKPPYQFHSHHHEHKVSIKKEIEAKNVHKLEPLFMAISGFVGMAVMFIISMLIFPKFGSKPYKTFWPKSKDMDELARLALNAIEGSSCRERFACELTKSARNFNIQENRFIKLLRRIAPETFGKHMNRFKNYEDAELKCTLIPCKKIFPQKVQKVKKTPVRKKNVAQKKN